MICTSQKVQSYTCMYMYMHTLKTSIKMYREDYNISCMPVCMYAYPAMFGHVPLQLRFRSVGVDAVHPERLAGSPLAKPNLGRDRDVYE